MWICDHCDKLWRAQMHACAGCGTVGLRVFGTAESDKEHPAAASMPVMQVTRPTEPASGEGDGADLDPAAPPLTVPLARDGVTAWRDYAIAQGLAADQVAEMAKPAIRAALDELVAA